MKKNLEDWLRGDVPHSAETTPASSSSDALELKLPVIPSHYLPLLPVPSPVPTAFPQIAPVRRDPVLPPPPEAPEEFLFVDFLRMPAGGGTTNPGTETQTEETEGEETEFPEAAQTPNERREEQQEAQNKEAENKGAENPEDRVTPGSYIEDANADSRNPDGRHVSDTSREAALPAEPTDERDPAVVPCPEEEDANDDVSDPRTDYIRNPYDYGEKKDVDENEIFQVRARAAEFPDQEAARFDEQLRRIEQMRRISATTGRRPGFRGNRGRLFTLCILVILIAGTVFALWRHMRRNSLDALMTEADDLYRQERYEPAFEVYSRAASGYPTRIEPLLGMAHSAERMGRIETAIHAYSSVSEVLPPDATGARSSTFCETGRLYSVLKSWDKAQEYFEKAVDLDATNYNAFFALGNALEEQDKPEKALSNYKRALDLSPSSDAASKAVKRITDRLNAEKKNAADAAAEAQKYGQAVQTGNVALGLKRYDEASQRFAEALAIRSDDDAVWVGFADAREGLGDTAGAIKSLERALERNPKNADARTKLDALTKAGEKKSPPAKKPQQPPKKSRSAPRGAISCPAEKRHAGIPTARDLSRRDYFETGVDRYRAGEYDEAFEAFLACLRSPARTPLPTVSLAGEIGPLWKGDVLQLRVPSDFRRLSEALRLNSGDRALYLNLSLTETRLKADRKTLRETIGYICSHALARRQMP